MTEHGNDLEQELRQALRRKEPSAGFAARVIANIPEAIPARERRWFAAPMLRWATAAVLVVAVGGGGYMYREHQQELERGRQAKEQLLLALRITGTKLQLAQQRVQQIGADRISTSQQETENQQ